MFSHFDYNILIIYQEFDKPILEARSKKHTDEIPIQHHVCIYPAN